MGLQIGDACPIFSLNDQNGNRVNISDYIGIQNLVVFFYPKDETPGCTKEVCAFRDQYERFKQYNCEVIGISSDSIQSHVNFSSKYRLSFSLLSDSQQKVRKMFGVPTKLFGLIPGRVTYIIDKKGIIRGIYNSLTDPIGHIEEALKLVVKLD